MESKSNIYFKHIRHTGTKIPPHPIPQENYQCDEQNNWVNHRSQQKDTLNFDLGV